VGQGGQVGRGALVGQVRAWKRKERCIVLHQRVHGLGRAR
jgi:hypothetical protein